MPGVAPAQQTISTTVLGPIYGDGSSITVTTSGTIDGIGSGSGVISTGTSTTTTLTNDRRIEAYSRGVLNEATGSFGTITNSGTISANWAVATSGTIGTFDNQSGGSIVGSDYAFVADGGAITTLQNDGSLTGYNAFVLVNTAIGAFTNSGSAAGIGGGNGLRLGAGGSIGSFTNSGVISGQPGVQFEADTSVLTATNSGTIAGYNGFISSGTLGTLTNTSTGLINGGNLGFQQSGGAVEQISNAGVITSGGYGVGLDTGATLNVLANSGTISGGNQGLLLLVATGTVNNLAGGLISGGYSDGVASGVNLDRLDNAGTIYGAIRGVNIASGTAGEITNSGSIDGNDVGVVMDVNATLGTLTNSGTISGGNSGAVLATTGTVTNSAGAVIHGGGNGGLATVGNVGLLDNAGLIDGTLYGLYAYAGPVTTLINSGTIQGGAYGNLLTMTTGTITNSGLIKGTNSALSVLGTVDTLTNATTGRIEGYYGGLTLSGTITSVVNDGQISAPSGTGLGNYGTTGTITNNGTITGSWGVYQDGTLKTFTNSASGLIHGDDVGFYEDYTVDAIDNYGTITGNLTAGVEFDASFSNIGVLTNHAGALIESSGGDGVLVGTYGNDYAAESVSNTGVIRGATSGVRVENGRLSSLVNTGTIAYGGLGSGPAVLVGPSGVLGDVSGTSGPALVSTGSGALLDGGIVNSGTINQGFLIGNQNVSVGAGSGSGEFNGGTLDVVDGNLAFTSGTLTLGAGVSVNGGSGTFTNEATLRLLGIEAVTGTFEQTSRGTVLMELLGTTSGSYGRLDISGTATFAGGLALGDTGLTGGLAGGQVFDLFGFGSYSGGFSGLSVNGTSLLSLGGGAWLYGALTLTEVWTGTTMSLSVTGSAGVPEIDPKNLEGVVAIVLGSLCLLWRNRPRAG